MEAVTHNIEISFRCQTCKKVHTLKMDMDLFLEMYRFEGSGDFLQYFKCCENDYTLAGGLSLSNQTDELRKKEREDYLRRIK